MHIEGLKQDHEQREMERNATHNPDHADTSVLEDISYHIQHSCRILGGHRVPLDLRFGVRTLVEPSQAQRSKSSGSFEVRRFI